jgi:hypothetical protein
MDCERKPARQKQKDAKGNAIRSWSGGQRASLQNIG